MERQYIHNTISFCDGIKRRWLKSINRQGCGHKYIDSAIIDTLFKDILNSNLKYNLQVSRIWGIYLLTFAINLSTQPQTHTIRKFHRHLMAKHRYEFSYVCWNVARIPAYHQPYKNHLISPQITEK